MAARGLASDFDRGTVETAVNKSEAIRELGRKGLPVAEIARRVSVRYQFARNVLSAAGMLGQLPAGGPPVRDSVAGQSRATPVGRPLKPPLQEVALRRAGFEHACRWALTEEGVLVLDRPLTNAPGVYVYVKDGEALYAGVATMGLSKRLYFYGRPNRSQKTNVRVNALLKGELRRGAVIDVYIATPADFDWEGFPVNGVVGLEFGLIGAFSLPWNIRGARV